MDRLVLADIPELTGTERNPRSRITVARLGKYQDPRYGKFEIAEADYEGWKTNLANTFGGKVSVDFDHSSDRGRGTEAAAWITGLERQGKDVIADVEWTPRGAKAVRDKSYQFISPTYTEHYKDEHGVDRGRALLGAACTNRPVLRQLPTLSLSREPVDGAATVLDKAAAKRERKRARQLAPPRDSQTQMPDLAELRRLLDLDEDADQVTILAAVAKLPSDGMKHPSPSHTPGVDADAVPHGHRDKAKRKARKLAKKAAKSQTMALDEDGNVQLSQDAYADLERRANLGEAASVQLAEQTFSVAWNKALLEGRAAPAQEENLRELHRHNPALAIKTLDSFVQIVPTKPTGSGENGNGGPAPLGMDDDRFQLHREAQALAAKKRSDDPKLDEGEAYSLAVAEIADRQFSIENPGI